MTADPVLVALAELDDVNALAEAAGYLVGEGEGERVPKSGKAPDLPAQ